MKTFKHTLSLTSTKIVNQYLKEIITQHDFTVDEIAKRCRISGTDLLNIIAERTENIASNLFHKILCFYCAVFYAPALIKNQSNSQPKRRKIR